MKFLSDLVVELINHWQDEDLPVNILIDDQYYDIGDFFFDPQVHEYIMELEGGIDYETRGDIMIERFMIDDAGSLIDKDTGKTYDYFEEVIDLINTINHERIENKRELNTLRHKIRNLIGG